MDTMELNKFVIPLITISFHSKMVKQLFKQSIERTEFPMKPHTRFEYSNTY